MLLRIFRSIAVAAMVQTALFAQAVSIASVTGRVTDEQNAVLAGTAIRLIGTNTGTVYNAVTNTEGIYTLPSIPIGEYRLEATSPGFQTHGAAHSSPFLF